MKVLVTGATGFLGSHLVPKLRAEGHHVRTIARSKPPPQWSVGDNPVEAIEADLSNRALLRSAVLGVEAVYHLAGKVSFRNEDGRAMYALHVDRTRELLEELAARKGSKARIILASTSGTIAVSRVENVGNESDDYPIREVGKWPYYMSKIFEEKMAIAFCRRHELPLIVLNPSLLLGPGDERLSSTWTIVKFLERDISAMPGGGISFADVRDVASAAEAALTRGELYGRHLMGVNMSMREFFQRLERMTGVAAPRFRLPRDLTILGGKLLEKWARWKDTRPALDPQEVEIGEHWFWLNAAKAERELGYCARDPHQTLFETVAYVKARIEIASHSKQAWQTNSISS